MSLGQVMVFLAKLANFIVETVDLFDHAELSFALAVEVGLNLTILLGNAIVKYFYFIFVGPLKLLNLNSS